MKKVELVVVKRKNFETGIVVAEIPTKGYRGEDRLLTVVVKFRNNLSEPVTMEVAKNIIEQFGDDDAEIVSDKKEEDLK